jgi:hypothetical protein
VFFRKFSLFTVLIQDTLACLNPHMIPSRSFGKDILAAPRLANNEREEGGKGNGKRIGKEREIEINPPACGFIPNQTQHGSAARIGDIIGSINTRYYASRLGSHACCIFISAAGPARWWIFTGILRTGCEIMVAFFSFFFFLFFSSWMTRHRKGSTGEWERRGFRPRQVRTDCHHHSRSFFAVQIRDHEKGNRRMGRRERPVETESERQIGEIAISALWSSIFPSWIRLLVVYLHKWLKAYNKQPILPMEFHSLRICSSSSTNPRQISRVDTCLFLLSS